MIDNAIQLISQKKVWPFRGLFGKTCQSHQEILLVKTDSKQSLTDHLFRLVFKSTGVALLLFIALFLYGCGGQPIVPVYEPSGQPSYPESTPPDAHVIPAPQKTDMLSGPAAPLHQKAQALLSQKEYKQAELAMERALRIEPKNGYYWYTLARIASAQNQPGRTVQLCLKSKSLARGDERLIQLNDHLIGK